MLKIRTKSKTHEFFYFAILRIIGEGVAFLIPLLIAYLTTPELFAQLNLSMTVALFFVTLGIGVASTPLIVDGAKEITETGKLQYGLTNLFIVYGSSFVFLFLLILTLNSSISEFIGMSNISWSLLILFGGISIKNTISTLYLASNKKNISALNEFIFGGTAITIIFIFKYMGVLSLTKIFLAYLAGAAMCLLTFLISSVSKQISYPKFSSQNFHTFFKFYRWQILGITALFFTNWIDLIILRKYVALSVIGEYALAYQIFKGCLTAFYSIDMFYLSSLSTVQSSTKKMQIYLKKTRRKIIKFAMLLIAILIITGPFVIYCIYSSNYPTTPYLLVLLLCALPFAIYNVALIPYLNVKRKFQFIQFVSLGIISANILFDLLLIPRFGAYGAALATLISYITSFLAYLIFLRVTEKISF